MGEIAVRVDNVNKRYGHDQSAPQVLRGVSLTVEKGEFLALVGQSGSGKSTLLNIMGGLDIADSGDVEVLGVSYRKSSDRQRADLRNREIGFVFQAFNLLDHCSVIENILISSYFADADGASRERGMQVLTRVGLADFAHRLPSELSGGQKQRVAIARALFQSPTLLLCDEPTGNLDSKTGAEIIELFLDINRNDKVTLVVVTHEKRVSSVATRVLTLHNGALVDSKSDDGIEGGAA